MNNFHQLASQCMHTFVMTDAWFMFIDMHMYIYYDILIKLKSSGLLYVLCDR